MQLQQIMDTNFDVISANDFAESALDLMRRHHKSALFVLGQDGIKGVIRHEEVADLHSAELRDKSVADLMSRRALRVPPDMSVNEAAWLISREPGSCLFVTWNNQPIGILTEHQLRQAVRQPTAARPPRDDGEGNYIRTAHVARR